MLEIIRNINNTLEYQYKFSVDRTPLYDKTKTNLYPTVDDDWHVYPLYGFLHTKETAKIGRYINTKVFNVMVRHTIQKHSIHSIIKTLDVRVKITINMMDKYIEDKKLRDIWMLHIQKLYNNRLKACMQYYIDSVLPF